MSCVNDKVPFSFSAGSETCKSRSPNSKWQVRSPVSSGRDDTARFSQRHQPQASATRTRIASLPRCPSTSARNASVCSVSRREGVDTSDTSYSIVFARFATRLGTSDSAPECFAGQASELASDNYRVSVGNSACSAVADKKTVDSVAADTAEEVGSFCFVEEQTDRGNPGRNCGCTGSDKGWGTESVDTRTVVERVEQLSGLHCGS